MVLLVLLAAAIYLGTKKLAIFYCNRGGDYYNKGLYNEASGLLKEAQAKVGENQEIEKLFDNISFEYSVSCLDKGACFIA